MIWPLTMAGRVMFAGRFGLFVLRLAEAGPLGQKFGRQRLLGHFLGEFRQLTDAKHERIAQSAGRSQPQFPPARFRIGGDLDPENRPVGKSPDWCGGRETRPVCGGSPGVPSSSPRLLAVFWRCCILSRSRFSFFGRERLQYSTTSACTPAPETNPRLTLLRNCPPTVIWKSAPCRPPAG